MNQELVAFFPLLKWLPNESLFSLVSRLDRLWGYSQAGKTAECLFGSRQQGIHHDFPSGLTSFDGSTRRSLGSALEIAHGRTLLKFYRSFLPLSESSSIAETMCGNSIAHLKFQLGLITSRFRANHPLKACPACMVGDQKEYGWAYWHLEHQYPGVWWCSIHERPLHESLCKATGVGRFLWYLPQLQELRECPLISGKGAVNKVKTAASLARTSIDLVKQGSDSPLVTGDFHKIYREELERRGWLKRGRLQYFEMAPDFVDYSMKLHHLPELAALPTTIEAAKSQLGRLLRTPRGGIHPLRHITLIDWLFGDTSCFMQAYQKPRLSSTSLEDSLRLSNCTRLNGEARHMDHMRDDLIKLLEKGDSIRSIALDLDIDINAAMAWAVDSGYGISRRPKVLKDDKRELMITMLRLGEEKAEVATKIGVSVTTVSRILRTELGLLREWKTVRFNKTREVAQGVWEALLTQYPHMGVKLLRSMEPAVYIWLYRNDRDWLKERSPHISKSPSSGSSNRVRWDKRDNELSAAVERAALALARKAPQATIRLWQLYQQIPELKAKLEVLHRLPLTKRAIEKVINKPASSMLYDNRLF